MSVGQALVSFALLAGVLTIIPGPDSALILRSALVQSRKHAYVTALGIASGTFVWGAAAAVGAAALLAASEFAFTVLKIVGALYLAYLGLADGLTGILLWPAVVLHAILTALLTVGITRGEEIKT